MSHLVGNPGPLFLCRGSIFNLLLLCFQEGEVSEESEDKDGDDNNNDDDDGLSVSKIVTII